MVNILYGTMINLWLQSRTGKPKRRIDEENMQKYVRLNIMWEVIWLLYFIIHVYENVDRAPRLERQERVFQLQTTDIRGRRVVHN